LPQDIAWGSDGNLWLANLTSIEKMTPAGVYTSYGVPGGDARRVTLGADSNIWFTEHNSNLIGRITLGGDVKEFPLPAGSVGPMDIRAGQDGNIWFTEDPGDKLGRITADGSVTEYDLPEGSSPLGFVEKPQGTFWIALSRTNQIARLTIPGGLELFDIPTANSYPYWVALDLEGNVWFTELSGNKVGKLVPPP
jgi:virginiamycin B lyase